MSICSKLVQIDRIYDRKSPDQNATVIQSTKIDGKIEVEIEKVVILRCI